VVVVSSTVVDVVVSGGGGGGGGGVTRAAGKKPMRYRAGAGYASRVMSRAFCEMLTTNEPCDSQGMRCAWYVFINGSPPRGATVRWSTVVQGPQGSVATSTASCSPQ
jgi:hypothetical protein